MNRSASRFLPRSAPSSKGVSNLGRSLSLTLLGSLAVACTASGDLVGDRSVPAGSPDESPAAAVSTAVPAGAIRGQLVRYVLTMEEGGMEVHHYLRTTGAQTEQRLLFAEPPTLEAGALVDVWGQPGADGIQVDRLVQLAAPQVEVSQQALIGDQPLKPRRFAFVLVDLGGGVNLTKADAERKLYGTGATDGSVRQYFIEASYGKQDIGGEVIGPIKATMTGCNFPNLATSLRGSVPAGFDHYLWYFGRRVASCGFAGVAVSGTPAKPTRDTWYNAASDCVVLVQEPAHNFGTMHSSSMKCRNNQPFADDPATTCVHNEYGDPYDPMGRGCRHMNGFQKAFQGWFGGCNVVDVNATGTFNLLPIETPCNGPQVLQIKMPKTRPFAHSGGGGGAGTTGLTHYYLEYRTPVGFDKGLTPVVQIRVSGDIRQRTQRGFNTWFLDMNPATAVLEGMVAGGTFSDPSNNIKITVMALDAKQATVKVEITGGTGGAPTCLDGKDLPTPAPGPESCSASPATPDGVPPPPPSDAGTTPTPSGSGGAGGSSPTASDGALLPIPFDAGVTEGFTPPGTSSGSGGSGSGGSGGGSKGGSSGQTPSGSGGSNGSQQPVAANNAASGGFGCRVADGQETAASGAASTLAGLLLFGLCVVRRRKRN